jgi:hypothetical protein
MEEPQMSWNPTTLYLALVILALLIIGIFRLDVDRGGYVDSFFSEDKLHHFLASALLTLVSHAVLKVPLDHAAWITFCAGVGFELVQAIYRPLDKLVTYAWRDIVVDAAGVLCIVLIFQLF